MFRLLPSSLVLSCLVLFCLVGHTTVRGSDSARQQTIMVEILKVIHETFRLSLPRTRSTSMPLQQRVGRAGHAGRRGSERQQGGDAPRVQSSELSRGTQPRERSKTFVSYACVCVSVCLRACVPFCVLVSLLSVRLFGCAFLCSFLRSRVGVYVGLFGSVCSFCRVWFCLLVFRSFFVCVLGCVFLCVFACVLSVIAMCTFLLCPFDVFSVSVSRRSPSVA